jgi:hypothetical protein
MWKRFLCLTLASSIVGMACNSSSGSGPGANTTDFCSKLSDFATQCNKTDPCTQAEVQNCSTLAGNFSSAFIAAADACVSAPYQCGDGGAANSTSNACLQQQLAGAAPTPAQTQVKNDFCAQCPDGASKSNPQSCSNFFSATPDGDGGTKEGPGYIVLISNDAIASQIDQKCTGGASQKDAGLFNDCATSFDLCSVLIFSATANTPKACNNGCSAGPEGRGTSWWAGGIGVLLALASVVGRRRGVFSRRR